MTSVDDKYADFLKEIEQLDSVVSAPPDSMHSEATPAVTDVPWECPWQTAVDETHGVPYYWHCETGETSWEPPEEYLTYLTAWERLCAGLDGNKTVGKLKKKKKVKSKKKAESLDTPQQPEGSDPTGLEVEGVVFGPDLPPASLANVQSESDHNSGSIVENSRPLNRPGTDGNFLTHEPTCSSPSGSNSGAIIAPAESDETDVLPKLKTVLPGLTEGGSGLATAKDAPAFVKLPEMEILPEKKVWKFWDPSASEEVDDRKARSESLQMPRSPRGTTVDGELYHGPSVPPGLENGTAEKKTTSSGDAPKPELKSELKSLVAYSLDDDTPPVKKSHKLLPYDDSDQEDGGDDVTTPGLGGRGAATGNTAKKAAFRKRFMEELYGQPVSSEPVKPIGRSSSAYAMKLGFVKSNTVVAQDEKSGRFVEVSESSVSDRLDPTPAESDVAKSPDLQLNDLRAKAEDLLDQIGSLNILAENMSEAEVVLVETKTRLEDFVCGQMTSKYFAKRLGEAERRFVGFLDECLEDGWEPNWNKELKKFTYQNLITGESQKRIPVRNMDGGTVTAPDGNTSEPTAKGRGGVGRHIVKDADRADGTPEAAHIDDPLRDGQMVKSDSKSGGAASKPAKAVPDSGRSKTHKSKKKLEKKQKPPKIDDEYEKFMAMLNAEEMLGGAGEASTTASHQSDRRRAPVTHRTNPDGNDDMDIDGGTDTDEDETHTAVREGKRRRMIDGYRDSPLSANALNLRQPPPLPPSSPRPTATMEDLDRADVADLGVGDGNSDHLSASFPGSRGSSASHSPSPAVSEGRLGTNPIPESSGVMSAAAVVYDAPPVLKTDVHTSRHRKVEPGNESALLNQTDFAAGIDPIFSIGGSGFDVYDSLDIEDYDDVMLKNRALEPDPDFLGPNDADRTTGPHPGDPGLRRERTGSPMSLPGKGDHLPGRHGTSRKGGSSGSKASGSENGDPAASDDLEEARRLKKLKKVKKEKPTKLNNTLAMKRKGIDGLVAKWKQVNTGEKKVHPP